jgi:hypothetical protein
MTFFCVKIRHDTAVDAGWDVGKELFLNRSDCGKYHEDLESPNQCVRALPLVHFATRSYLAFRCEVVV